MKGVVYGATEAVLFPLEFREGVRVGVDRSRTVTDVAQGCDGTELE
jgi:hypothetical protein